MSPEHDSSFRSMGSDIRLLIGPPIDPKLPPAAHAAAVERATVERVAARLTRFSPDSELSALNRDVRREAPASQLLRAAVRAGVWAAERTDGLVDPTLLRAIEQAGYARSLDRVEPAPIDHALAAAPPRQPARPDPRARWRQIDVDDATGVIRRPPGLEIDTGGVGKGLTADAVAHRLAGYSRFAVDCGGDIAVGGIGAWLRPYPIEVEHPLTGEVICTVPVSRGGIATSGLNVRLWRSPDRGYGHHLLDPATGAPAWTGLVGVTALGRSALEAETLSKCALLLGPVGAEQVLAEHGGVLVHDDGDVQLIGSLVGGSAPSRR
jgi:thiamine biosynthesis lipoprotein